MISRNLRAIAHGLLLVAAMLALIAVALWCRGPAIETEAAAGSKIIGPGRTGFAQAGDQRQTIITELKTLNSRLQSIESALRDGDYTIQTKPADDKGRAAAAGGKP